MNQSPILDTLWMRCLAKEMEKAKRNNYDAVRFDVIDDLIVEASKMPIEDFIKWIKGEGCE